MERHLHVRIDDQLDSRLRQAVADLPPPPGEARRKLATTVRHALALGLDALAAQTQEAPG